MAHLAYQPRAREPRLKQSMVGFAAGGAILLVAVAVGLLTPAASKALFEDSAFAVAGSVLLVLIVGAPTVSRLRQHGFDAPGLYALATCLLIGLTALTWLRIPPDAHPILSQRSIGDALRVVALGLVAFGIGARTLGRPIRSQPSPSTLDHRPPMGLMLILYAISVVGQLIAVAVGSYGYSATPEARLSTAPVNQVLDSAVSLSHVIIFVAALVYFRTSDGVFRWFLIGAVTIQTGFGFAAGFKGSVIFPILFVLVAYALVRRRLPWRALILVVVFLLVYVLPTNLRYREQVRAQSDSPAAVLRATLTTLPELNPVDVARNARDYLSFRFRSVDSVALIRLQTPSRIDFAGGEKYWLLPAIIAVPRALWPDKPVLEEGARFTNTYVGAPTEVRSSTQITQVGDLYRNFGYPGVIIGMFVWGVIMAAMVAMYSRRRSPRAEALYAFVVVNVVFAVEVDLPSLVAIASRSIPVAAVAAWLLLPGRTGPPLVRMRRAPTARASSA